MKLWKVVLTSRAQDTLADFWPGPDIRHLVGPLADGLTDLLSEKPLEAGESREGTRFGARRIVMAGRLQFIYAIDLARRLVVTALRLARRAAVVIADYSRKKNRSAER